MCPEQTQLVEAPYRYPNLVRDATPRNPVVRTPGHGLARAWGGVRPHARRWRGSRYLSPVWASSVRPTPQGPRQQSCHGPCSRPVPPVPAWSVMPYPQPPRQRSCHGGCYPGPAPLHAAARLARSPCRRPPPPLSHKLRSVAGGANVVAEVGSLCASGSGSSHAQPWSIMRTVIARFLKTPRCSRNLLEAKFRANAPCGTPRGRGVLVSLSPAAVPGGPDTDHASKAVMVCASCPGALAPSMRHLHRAKRWRRLVAGSAAKRLPWCRAWRDFFESLTGSPQALSAAAVTALLDAAKRRVDGRAVRRHPLRLRASRSGATGRPGSNW